MVGLSACPGAPAPITTTAPTRAPVRGGALTLLVAGDLDALDPHLAATPASWTVARALHRGLYAYPDIAGRTGTEPLPDLATSAPIVDADGKGARIIVSPVTRFASGARVRAADVVASLRRVRASDRGIGPALKSALIAVEEVDDLIVHVTPQGAIGRLVDLLAHPQAAIMPAATPALQKVRAPKGAGPYVLATEAPDRYVLRRRTDVVFDAIRPAHPDTIEVRVGPVTTVAPGAVVLDGGPPDLVDPAASDVGRTARVATGCVRYLDLSGTAAGKRRQIAARLARLAAVGANPVARGPVPPLLQARRLPAAAPTRASGQPTLDVVTSTSPRDRAEVAVLRKALPRIRVRAVDPDTLYGGGPAPGGARIRTWCADWPDALAITRSRAAAATAIPLWWPVERVRIGARIRGFVGSPMFPRGDPTAMWLG